ncbi:uroporphyrinogen-III synthase [Pragia fontium]|uniref:Uroporphyrinogen-III synthase n=1 Tax=Pragia fontium TaxID=82985 RepID=A0ABQ5LLL3_9GAMM|nr:uroporphyrinogen-III synthase [Pragia fontium]GKX64518.1 uroporphyrinogen-III synthase [Pragia fontium]VEJ57040.1 uroporphyrinogen-III synthase [Pragia fontium]
MSILITRPSPMGEALVKQLIEQGREAYHTPLITFSPGRELDKLPDYLANLREDDIIIAASQHAVHYAHDLLKHKQQSWPENCRYFAIGYKTATELQQATRFTVHWPEGREISEQLLELPQLQHVAGKNILILRGNGGRQLLAETLQKRGASVTFCECYQRNPIAYHGDDLCQYWQQISINILVITSGEMLQQLYELVPTGYRNWLLNCHLLIVSERLADQAKNLGWTQCHIADNADNDALLRALQQI